MGYVLELPILAREYLEKLMPDNLSDKILLVVQWGPVVILVKQRALEPKV